MRNISAGNDRRVAMLREFERSGLSMAEFCRRHGVGYSTMAAWRRTLRGQTATFVEVEPLEHGHPPDGCRHQDRNRSNARLCAELQLPGGAVLRVYQITPPEGQP